LGAMRWSGIYGKHYVCEWIDLQEAE
jgi:hypothetical protein